MHCPQVPCPSVPWENTAAPVSHGSARALHETLWPTLPAVPCCHVSSRTSKWSRRHHRCLLPLRAPGEIQGTKCPHRPGGSKAPCFADWAKVSRAQAPITASLFSSSLAFLLVPRQTEHSRAEPSGFYVLRMKHFPQICCNDRNICFQYPGARHWDTKALSDNRLFLREVWNSILNLKSWKVIFYVVLLWSSFLEALNPRVPKNMTLSNPGEKQTRLSHKKPSRRYCTQM